MQRSVQPAPDTDAAPASGRELSIRVENFGPITKGAINLKPLTIFVGPNGCGKSHAASLFYIMSNLEQDHTMDNHFARRSMQRRRLIQDSLKDESTKIFEQHREGSDIVDTHILSGIADPEAEVKSIIVKNFLAEPKAMIQRRKKSAVLDAKSRISGRIKVKITSDRIKVEGLSKPTIRIRFQETTDPNSAHAHNDESTYGMMNINIPASGSVFDIYDALVRRLTGPRRMESSTYYFPAERAGLTLASRSIAANYLLHRGTDANLPSTATDYLVFWTLLSDREGVFADIARDAEKKIMQGEIVTAPAPEMQPEIYFRSGGYKFPLHSAASSVKDLAPFFLYLKRAAKKNDLIVLEEPEINLHPASQIRLARFIARLVNRGLYVVVTTHSPYFLEQISHCVKAGHIDNENVDNVLPDEERIRPDSVAPYKFAPLGGGYEILEMPVSAEGIPQEEFTSVDRSLYDELLQLRRLEQE